MRRKTSKWTPPAAASGKRRFDDRAPITSIFRFPRILPARNQGWLV